MAVALLSGCGGHIGQMDKAEDPQGRYREQIAAIFFPAQIPS